MLTRTHIVRVIVPIAVLVAIWAILDEYSLSN